MGKIILDVPYYSQHLDVKDENWKPRSCGILCLKMVLDFYKINNLNIDKLIEHGVSKNGFSASGWVHDVLVEIANSFGLNACRREYKDNPQEGIDDILSSLKGSCPVLVSAVKDFSEKDKFHMVLLTGLEKTGSDISGFYYHDPDSHGKTEKKNKFVPLNSFKKNWRKMAIFAKI